MAARTGVPEDRPIHASTAGNSLGDGARIELPTKSALVHGALREAILGGSLAAGVRLNLSQLARQLGTSETPVREALYRLESERLVRVEPHAGFIVTEVRVADLVENLILRRSIEALATRMAAVVMTQEDLASLSAYVDEMEVLATQRDWSGYVAVNKRFHRAIIEFCPLPVLRRTAVELWEVGERTRELFIRKPSFESNLEHRQMLEAIAAKDFDLLDRLVKQQKSNSIQVAMATLGEDDVMSAEGVWGISRAQFEVFESSERTQKG